MSATVYPSDLTDAEWAFLEPLIPAAKPGGRPRKAAAACAATTARSSAAGASATRSWKTLGLIRKAKVHTVDVQDRAAVPQALEQIQDALPHLEHLWADQGDTGSGKA